jgi:hypothetical protein
MYRVWTIDSKQKGTDLTCHTGWLTKKQAYDYCLGRWGFVPGWAFVSQAHNYETLRRRYGLECDGASWRR